MPTTGERRDRVVVTVDLGTGGPKIGLVSVDGRILWARHRAVETVRQPDGGAEQDAQQWWDLVREGIREGLASGACCPCDVVAVSVTGQWASTVPVDATGRPVAPALMWMDTRGGPLVRSRVGGHVAGYAPWKLLEYLRRSGGAPSLDGADPTGHRLFVHTRRPDVWAAARWFLEPVDYLSMRFTGVAAASAASMIASWLCDTRDPAVTRYVERLLALAGAGIDKLPPLHPFGTRVAEVAPAVAHELGLPAGVTVVTGSPDLHSSAMGAGAVRDYDAHVAISTTSWVSFPAPAKHTDVRRSIATVPGLTPDRYLVANTQETAGRSLQWLRDVLTRPGTACPDYDELTALAATSRPGARGVVFTPWLDGERSPVADRDARAGFHHVSIGTSQADLVRAVMEGVALNTRWLFRATERFAGRRLDHVRVVGGGAASDLWCEILADVLDRTVEQVDDPVYAGLRGAALIAGVALGALDPSDVRRATPIRAVYQPDRSNRQTYDALSRAFPSLYRAQRRTFARPAPDRGRRRRMQRR